MQPVRTSKLILLLLIVSAASVIAQPQKIRVACIGNSITQGFGTSDPRSYPQQLGALLGSHYDVRNYGVGGRTLLKKGDFPYWNEPAFLEAQDFDPHIVIIKLGTNDSKPQNWVYKNEFYSDYMDLVRTFRKNGRDPQIFICRPCPVVTDNFGITNSIVRDEIIPLADSVKKMTNSFMIDFYYTMLGRTGVISSDGVHPTEEGYKLMGQIAYDALMKGPSGVARYFYANKQAYEKGESVTLYWETTKGSAVTINGTAVKETDSMIVQPGSNIFTLIAKGEFTDTISISLKYLAPGMIKSFTASPEFLDKDLGDSTRISWEATAGSQVKLNGSTMYYKSYMTAHPVRTTTYTLTASGDVADTARVTVQVVASNLINRALKCSVSSTVSLRGFYPESAVDGNVNTYWESGIGNTHYLKLDLGRVYNINRAVINWGKTYGKLFRLEAQTDAAASPVVIYSNIAGTGGISDITGLTGEGRYIRLLCLSKGGMTDSSYVINEVEIYGTPKQATAVERHTEMPADYSLEQNYPNPFNPQTKIDFQLPERSDVILKVYDIAGREIAELLNGSLEKGQHSIIFDGANYPSGVYFYRISAGRFSRTRSMLLLK
ncbi:MAG: GDSL-type esterase/lipase family protein [Syntrophothermus sp.]